MNLLKKTTIFLSFLLLGLVLVACNNDTSNNDTSNNDKQKYTINFIIDGEVLEVVEFKESEEYIIPTAPIKTGMDFSGWYFDEAFTLVFDKALISKQLTNAYGKYLNKEVIDEKTLNYEYNYVSDLVSEANTQLSLINNNLRRSNLLRENSIPLLAPRANLWTFSAYFTMVNRLYLLERTTDNYEILLAAYDELEWYRSKNRNDNHLVYASKNGNEAPAFYDDNIWLVIGFINGYKATNNEEWLNKAKAIIEWIYLGWGENETHKPGGLYWREFGLGQEYVEPDESRGRNTASNGPTAMASMMLYEITKDEYYYKWGEKIYNWTKATLLDQPTKLYNDHINGLDQVNGWKFTYNTGTMLSTASYLYKYSTGRKKAMYQADVKDLIWGSTQFGKNGVRHPHSFTMIYDDIPNAYFYIDNPWFRVYLHQGYLDAMRFVDLEYGAILEKIKNGLSYARINSKQSNGFLREDWAGKVENEDSWTRTLFAAGSAESIVILEQYQRFAGNYANN